MNDCDSAPTALDYRRARFSTRLPGDRRFTASHFWIGAHGPEGALRIGLTKFATRMLGEMVEHGFEVKSGDPVAVGQIIGWLEGFKATTDLFCVASGRFIEGNPLLTRNLDALRGDPYGVGWLYAVAGAPEADWLDAPGYAALLDATIDRMLEGEGDVHAAGVAEEPM